MYLFMISILGMYGAVHAYVFVKLRSGVGFGIRGGLLIGLFLAMMCIAPVLVRILERVGFELAGRLLAAVAYSWMGFVFLFFCLAVMVDLAQLMIQGLASISPVCAPGFRLSPRLALFLPLCLALGLALYGCYQAWQVKPHQITLTSAKIPAQIGRVRIVQIADVHLGLMIRERRLSKIMDVVRQAEPDLLVSTGDLVDGQIDSLAGLARFLQDIHPRYGKFAVTGNHEFYAGIEHAMDFMRQTGFTVLRGEQYRVNGWLTLAGLDDPAGKGFGVWRPGKESELLSEVSGTEFVLLLKHLPLVADDACGRFDLQLSGHTHKGQIFPFSILTRLFFVYHAGWYDLPQGSGLYVSRGTGTWGPPMRLGAPPEVTVIDLVSAS
jgi:hypothetical protein